MRHRSWFPRGVVATLAMILPLLLGLGASALPRYEIVALGLKDAEHTRSTDGAQFSSGEHLTESGYVAGFSLRYIGGASAGHSVWLYDGFETTRLGFIDAEHTKADGFQSSSLQLLNESGAVLGWSERYAGTEHNGRSLWRYDGTSLVRLGYFDADHSGSEDGYQLSLATDLTETGFVAGTSVRLSGPSYAGQSAWLDDGVGTVRLGYFDEQHTRAGDGVQLSLVNHLTESGYAAGSSNRYFGPASAGFSAWRYDGARTVRLGYFDGDHTRSGDAFQSSDVGWLTESGSAMGTSERFIGASSRGRSIWLYDGADTTRLGFFDEAHTGTDGSQFSWPLHLTESGFAAGTSDRFSGDDGFGVSVWLYDGVGTTRLGFSDAEHTGVNGYQASSVRHLTEPGFVAGASQRFAGAKHLGSSAWWYDGIHTVRLGLADEEHTRNDGYQSSRADFATASGSVAGISIRYREGGESQGATAWLYDGSRTIRLGLTDVDHTQSSFGYRSSDVSFLTESGYVAGQSNRYAGVQSAGSTAWVFNPEVAAVRPIVLSDGFGATSHIDFLGEDGLVLGSYSFYDTDGTFRRHAFVWTPDDGAVDLGVLVDGGISREGWDALVLAIRANGLPEILGQGRLAGNEIAYLLAPVPEPGAIALLLVGLLVLSPSVRLRIGVRSGR